MAPWLSWILLGLIAGSIAKFLVPGRDLPGCVVTVVLGIAGALVGGVLGAALGLTSPGHGALDVRSISVATAGAVLVLVVLRLVGRRFTARRRPPGPRR